MMTWSCQHAIRMPYLSKSPMSKPANSLNVRTSNPVDVFYWDLLKALAMSVPAHTCRGLGYVERWRAPAFQGGGATEVSLLATGSSTYCRPGTFSSGLVDPHSLKCGEFVK